MGTFFLVDEELERIATNLAGSDLEPFGTIGGVSGSAVFVNRDGDMIPVGVLYEAGEGIETIIFVAHIDRILADGTV